MRDETTENGGGRGAFPYTVTEETRHRRLSAAMERSFKRWPTPRPEDNPLYSQFRYTPLEGFDYSGGDGTVSRRDPSMVVFENGRYYVWYTRRRTPACRGPERHTDTVPAADWDLAEIWYATSEDGFVWREEGVAVPRPPAPHPGWRSVATPGILKFGGRFYLYYQAFLEPPMVRGDWCPIAVSHADSPDGPWTPTHQEVLPVGAPGAWDQYAVQDPNLLVRDGKIYLYYKSAFNRPHALWVAQGLAIAADPLGPFERHPLNPVINSSHEVALFPFKKGVACLSIFDGQEHFTVQYAEDWVNLEIASITELMPTAAGPFVPDAFTDTADGRGITWGLCHFRDAGGPGAPRHCILGRFDCDLSQDVRDPEMKKSHYRYSPEHHFQFGLSEAQRRRAEEDTMRLRGGRGPND